MLNTINTPLQALLQIWSVLMIPPKPWLLGSEGTSECGEDTLIQDIESTDIIEARALENAAEAIWNAYRKTESASPAGKKIPWSQLITSDNAAAKILVASIRAEAEAAIDAYFGTITVPD